MVIEAAVATVIKLGGVVIVSTMVEKGLEMMGKEHLAGLIKVVTFAGIGIFTCSALMDLFNHVGRVFL